MPPPIKHPMAAIQAMKAETSRRQSTHAPPPPIAEVLRDLYEEEKKTA